MAPTISYRANVNHAWLESGGWTQVSQWFQALTKQRDCEPQNEHATLERQAAHFADQLEGIGPKQSRNLWQWLGLTRYETPLDSQVVGWINRNLSVEVNTSKLGDDRYYETVMDYLQEDQRKPRPGTSLIGKFPSSGWKPNGWQVFQNRSFCIVLVIVSRPTRWRGQVT